jgi:hypothetical protein
MPIEVSSSVGNFESLARVRDESPFKTPQLFARTRERRARVAV